jgi:hypothetical protein
MNNNGGDYIDYLNHIISENYANYWKFEIERGSTPADHYKADKFISVLSLLEEIRTFYIENVKHDKNYDGLSDLLDLVYEKITQYDVNCIESFTLNMVVLGVLELLKSQQVP